MKNLTTLLCLFFLNTSILLAQDTSIYVIPKWNNMVLETINKFPSKGGYYTGGKPNKLFSKTAAQGMNEAFIMNPSDSFPNIDVNKAQPSFCSLATYMVLLKTILDYDTLHIVSKESWQNLKPYIGIKDSINSTGFSQGDGIGCWGRANANGPGFGVLISELGVGCNIYGFRGAKEDKYKDPNWHEEYESDSEWAEDEVWRNAEPGDFMKIFWDNNSTSGKDNGAVIGYNANSGELSERGHMVVFLGYTPEGDVKYWSSNGPGEHPEKNGYGIATTPKNRIQRVIFTRILVPENFNNAQYFMPDNEQSWLKSLDGKHRGTSSELRYWIGDEWWITKTTQY